MLKLYQKQSEQSLTLNERFSNALSNACKTHNDWPQYREQHIGTALTLWNTNGFDKNSITIDDINYAACAGNLPFFKTILAGPETRNIITLHDQGKLLYMAVSSVPLGENIDIIKMLLSKKPDGQEYEFPTVVKNISYNDYFSFYIVACHGNINILNLFLAKKPDGQYEFIDIDKIDNPARLYLQRGGFSGNFKVAARLLAQKNSQAEFPKILEEFKNFSLQDQFSIAFGITRLEQVNPTLGSYLLPFLINNLVRLVLEYFDEDTGKELIPDSYEFNKKYGFTSEAEMKKTVNTFLIRYKLKTSGKTSPVEISEVMSGSSLSSQSSASSSSSSKSSLPFSSSSRRSSSNFIPAFASLSIASSSSSASSASVSIPAKSVKQRKQKAKGPKQNY